MVNIEPIKEPEKGKNESSRKEMEIESVVEDVTKPEKEDNTVTLQTAKDKELHLDALVIEELATKIVRPSAKVHLDALVQELRSKATPTAPETKAVIRPVAKSSPIGPLPVSTTPKYNSINKFALDLGGYNSPVVTLYLDIPDIGSISKEKIKCHFTKSSVDLVIHGLNGKNYRLLKDNLDKDIDPDKSKYVVKKHKIIVKLAKVKAEYGLYDSWQNLSSKKSKKSKEKIKSNPSESIMEMMKEMYDSGDDNMRKVIGETMLKQRNGELGKDREMPSYPGMDNMDI